MNSAQERKPGLTPRKSPVAFVISILHCTVDVKDAWRDPAIGKIYQHLTARLCETDHRTLAYTGLREPHAREVSN